METSTLILCRHCNLSVRPLEDVATGNAVCPDCATFMGMTYQDSIRSPASFPSLSFDSPLSRSVFSTHPAIQPLAAFRRSLPVPRPANPGDSSVGISSSAWIPDQDPAPSMDLTPDSAPRAGRRFTLWHGPTRKTNRPASPIAPIVEGWMGLPLVYYLSAGAVIIVLLLVIAGLLLA